MKDMMNGDREEGWRSDEGRHHITREDTLEMTRRNKNKGVEVKNGGNEGGWRCEAVRYCTAKREMKLEMTRKEEYGREGKKWRL